MIADVAGVHPAVVVDGLGGLVGQAEVSDEHVAAAGEHLAVVGDLHLDTGGCRSDVAGLRRRRP